MEKGKGERLQIWMSHWLLPAETEMGANRVSVLQALPSGVYQSCCQLDAFEYSAVPNMWL